MEFIEAPAFSRHLSHYLDDESYRELQTKLAANPDLGDVMPGTGGVRKLRWADARRGKGRRGGFRSICYHFKFDSAVLVKTFCDKNREFNFKGRGKEKHT